MKKKNTKTKPGEFQKKKEFYRSRQVIFDAVKKARDEGSAMLTFEGVEYEVLPDFDFEDYTEVLFMQGGQIQTGLYIVKDGHHVLRDNGDWIRNAHKRIITGIRRIHPVEEA